MEIDLKLKNLSADQTKELLPEGLIFLAYRGSVAHGMYVPPTDPNSVDDKDLLGVFIAPVEHYLGFGRKDTFEKWINEYDSVYYELRKFVSLLLKCNPNVLSMLWLDPKHILFEHEIAKQLRENRDMFVSKKAYHAFTGYAYGQFKRMTQFEKQGYMGEKRKQLVSRFGYDTKNAAHLIRLLNMGIEFLTEGILYVERKNDARHLLAIKNGEHSLEEVKEEAEHLFKLAKEAYVKSTLPCEPDRKRAEQLLLNLVSQFYSFNYESL